MSDDERNVIPFPQKGGTPADDALMRLPECPASALFCGNCGVHIDVSGRWVSRDGCPLCLTEREQRFLDQRNEAWSQWGEVTRDHAHLLGAAREAVRIGKVSGLRAMIDVLDENARCKAAANSEMLERRAGERFDVVQT